MSWQVPDWLQSFTYEVFPAQIFSNKANLKSDWGKCQWDLSKNSGIMFWKCLSEPGCTVYTLDKKSMTTIDWLIKWIKAYYKVFRAIDFCLVNIVAVLLRHFMSGQSNLIHLLLMC